jgi:hypothetical protein
LKASSAKNKAEAAFKKEQRVREGAKAMAEYKASQLAEQKKTERLRALRLARDAKEAEAAAERPAPISAARTTTARRRPRKATPRKRAS